MNPAYLKLTGSFTLYDLKVGLVLLNKMKYTNVVQLGQKLSYELKSFLENNKLIGTKDSTYLVDSFETFLELLSDPIVSKELDNYKLQIQNPVEKYGVAAEVIALLEEGKSNGVISEHLAYKGLSMISTEDIRKFSKEYETADVINKIEKSNTNVFDTTTQLQVIFDTLNDKLAKLNYVDDERLAKAKVVREQLELEYTRELRMTLKDAAQLAQAIENLNRQQKFNQLVLRTVSEKCGAAVYNSVVAEIRKQQLIFGM